MMLGDIGAARYVGIINLITDMQRYVRQIEIKRSLMDILANEKNDIPVRPEVSDRRRAVDILEKFARRKCRSQLEILCIDQVPGQIHGNVTRFGQACTVSSSTQKLLALD
jgi:hypothetical protein